MLSGESSLSFLFLTASPFSFTYILDFYEVGGMKVAPPHREVLGKSRELTFTVHTSENFIINNLGGRRNLQKTEDLISDVIGKIILKYEYK